MHREKGECIQTVYYMAAFYHYFIALGDTARPVLAVKLVSDPVSKLVCMHMCIYD